MLWGLFGPIKNNLRFDYGKKCPYVCEVIRLHLRPLNQNPEFYYSFFVF